MVIWPRYILICLVLVALHAGVSNDIINRIGLWYAVSRLAFGLCYKHIESLKLSFVRSFFWWSGNICCFTGFWFASKKLWSYPISEHSSSITRQRFRHYQSEGTYEHMYVSWIFLSVPPRSKDQGLLGITMQICWPVSDKWRSIRAFWTFHWAQEIRSLSDCGAVICWRKWSSVDIWSAGLTKIQSRTSDICRLHVVIICLVRV